MRALSHSPLFSLDHPKTLRLLGTIGLLLFSVAAGYAASHGGMRYPAAVVLFCLMVLFRKWQEPYVLAAAVMIFFCSGSSITTLMDKGMSYRWHGLFLLVGIGGLRAVYEERLGFRYRPLYVAIIVWCGYLLWSCFWAWDIEYSAPRAIAICLILIASFFTVGRYLDGGWERMSLLLASLCVAMTPFLLAQFAGWGNTTLDGRFEGIMGHVNSVGGIVTITVPLALYLMLDGPIHPLLRVLSGVLFAASVVCLVLCASRSAVLGAGVAMGIYLTIRNPWKVIFALSGAGLVLAMLVGYDVDIIQVFGLETLVRPETLATGTNRLTAWYIGWHHHLEQPIWGHGFFSGRFLVTETAWIAIAKQMGFGHFHNSYIEVLVDLGWLGAFPFAVFLLSLPVMFLKRWRDAAGDRRYRMALLGLGAVLISGLIHAVFESWLLQPGNITTLLFWSLMAAWLRLAMEPEIFRLPAASADPDPAATEA